MTPAELKTTLEAIGCTRAQVYERAGISMQRLYDFTSPSRTAEVPAYVADAAHELEAAFSAAADRLATEYLSDPEAECLLRYTSEVDYWATTPELDGWPLSSQGLLLAEVRRRLDQPARIEWGELEHA